MIAGAAQEYRTDQIRRLIPLPSEKIDALLVKRGLLSESIEEAKAGLQAVGVAVNVDEVIEFSFRPRDGDVPYGIGRFGDGWMAIFYAAREEETCVAELRHVQEQRAALAGPERFERHYDLLECTFSGVTLNLLPHAASYPDLISQTDSGYPFCRAVAAWAVAEGAQALHTLSARRAEGTCVPVFDRAALSRASISGRYRFVWRDGKLDHDKRG